MPGTALRGLPGFRLQALSEHDGHLERAVVTTREQNCCVGCGVSAVTHGRRLVQVRHLPLAAPTVTLLGIKPDCDAVPNRVRKCFYYRALRA